MVRLLVGWLVGRRKKKSGFNPTMVRLLRGKILGFDGKTEGNGKGVAVDLRLAEKPKGVDGN